MAYVSISSLDVSKLLGMAELEATQENVEKVLYEVAGFSRMRMGEFGLETEESALRIEDVGKNRWYEVDKLTHKSQFFGTVTADRFVGYERKDEDWLTNGNPSEDVKLEVRNDPAYNQIIHMLSRRREVS